MRRKFVLTPGPLLDPGPLLWTPQRLEAELERQISRELRRLSSRTEASATVSEWTVLPADEEGEPQSIFEHVEGSIANGHEEVERKEDEAGLRMELERRLNVDEIARGVEAVTAARKRLERKARGLQS